jgi:outer membrane immunogenic protein
MRRVVVALSVLASVAIGLSAASAADLPVHKGPPVAVAPAYNWTGFYAGVHFGGAWGRSTWVPTPGLLQDPSNRHDISGALGGIQLGYNLQMGTWLFGVEGDVSGADIVGTGIFDPTIGRDPIETRVRWIATGTGRIGYAAGPWLPYFRGGVAFKSVRYNLQIPAVAVNATTNDTQVGYVVGVGVEYGFAPDWSVRFSYDYMDFDNDRIAFASPGLPTLPNFPFNIEQHMHVAKAAVNYRFWGGRR